MATWLVDCYIAWLYGIDQFLFIIVKVVARALNRGDILDNIDLQGPHFRAHENAKELLLFLASEETREIFLQYAQRRHCTEQVEFLIEILSCTTSKDSTNHTLGEKVVHIADEYVRPDSDKEVNLPHEMRDKLIRNI
ncbi:hypothetical protein SARC_02333 [Sphaeroforma arctica JP610]|uniref:RGS domain-containing protein n=1 Tax=Sphaeroforma arctica JP610 TaxID=667725 RepID=A0A0L0G9D0_9EUKA|nr:hypothetical protein SARC_02333 [Sphaeroforma arctica JP610]KNC85496.1 hypothetical protein SARC_02333 [Sphaeroforma arctica JP610]|eukprot:XP_014159398.1 hypothetical protein SARC_02333 [Sphaeroforma arctica JP610]